MERDKLIVVAFLLLSALFILGFLNSLVFAGNGKLLFASNIHPKDQGCYNMGGECVVLSHERPYGSCNLDHVRGRIIPNLCNSDMSQFYRCCVPVDSTKDKPCAVAGGTCVYLSNSNSSSCTVNGSVGEVVTGLCKSDSSLHYRCCVPKEAGEEEKKADDPVVSDRGCSEMGGTCMWVSEKEDEDGFEQCETGCSLTGPCRTEGQNLSEGEKYVCCAPSDWCEGRVDYEKWDNVNMNRNCPFSKSSESETKIHCSQGPFTSPSHSKRNAVDVRWKGDVDFGTEFFVAPDDGCVTKSMATYTNSRIPTQKCGGILVFETKGGVKYTLIHAFVFGSLQKSSDSDVKDNCYSKGTVLARIALESDNNIINFIKFEDNEDTCASAPHFHVLVEGIDKCADCHFVDDLGCDLRNPSQMCNGEMVRCWRETPLRGQCEDGCTACKDNPKQYCCETDCAVIDGVKTCKIKASQSKSETLIKPN